MPFVKFLRSCETVEEVPQVFEANRVYELPETSCERWIRRGAAVQCDAPVEVTAVDSPEREFVEGEDIPAKKTARRKA